MDKQDPTNERDDAALRQTADREMMVAVQVARRGVSDERVLAALRRVPRHRFVPPAARKYAYQDRPLPIGHGQTISQPFIVARMTEALRLQGSERVLEIGTGCGYQTAVLAELAREVYSVEIVAPLARQAAKVLADCGYIHVHTRIADGHDGWPEAAPFDAITVTCAPEHVPQPLVAQLAQGGRMVVPVGPEGGMQELLVLRKTVEGMEREAVLTVRFVPMTGGRRAG